MIDALQRLIDALREELQQYGEMLALLDQQQEQTVARTAADLLQTVAAITAQTAVVQQARERRHQAQRRLAGELNIRGEGGFAEALPLLPEAYRPLLKALVDENNELLIRVQQRARQNHLLLSRSMELMQQFLSTLFPAARSSVYRGDGGVSAPALPSRPLYEAVG